MALLRKLIYFILFSLVLINSASAFVNIAFNKTTWESNETIGFPSSLAVDNNTAAISSWIAAVPATNGYMGVDLNSSVWIQNISILFGTVGAMHLYINGSTDNSTYSTLYNNAAFTPSGLIFDVFPINSSYRYINITIYGSGGGSAQITEIYVFSDRPALIYPTPALTIPKTFPPLTENVNFTWSLSPDSYSSNIIIARDSGFALVEADTTTTNNYSVQSLVAGTYYWKVRYYNPATSTYFNYSATSNFTITSTSAATGTGIDGIIYELIGGVQTPISGVQVYISNTTYTDSMITGSNGYFLFNSLANNSTYSLIAKTTGYDDSQTEYVTTGAGTITTKDIRMNKCKSSFTCNYDSRFTKFIVTSLFGTRYSGVTVNAYKGSDVVATLTGTTGADGDVTFFVVKDQSYRITFTSVSQGISLTRIITPGEDPEYYIIVTPDTLTWWTNNSHTEVGTIDFVVSTYQINSTAAYVNFTYNDSLVQTTAWTVYLNQSNHTNVTWPQITVQSISGANNNTSSFLITPYKGQSFLVNLVATHTTFGTVKRNFGVNFPGLAGGQLDFITDFFKALIAIAIIIFAGAMFDYPSRNQGAGVVCALGWIFLGIGFFNYFNTIAIIAGLSIATVFVIFMNMNERARQEDIS